MRKRDLVGWLLLAATVVTSFVYSLHYFDEGGTDVTYIFFTSAVYFAAPAYCLFILLHYLCVKRIPPRRFLAGVALFWLTIVGWSITDIYVGLTGIVQLAGVVLLILSFLLMKPEIEHLMLAGSDDNRDKNDDG